MLYKSYATRSTLKSRLARKRARREIFSYNKKLARNRRKEARLFRRQLEQV